MAIPDAAGANNPNRQVSVDTWNSAVARLNRFIDSVDDLVDACATGGTYFIMSGTYNLDGITLRPVSGTSLIGAEGETIFTKAATPVPFRTHAFIDIEDASNVLIEGITFDHEWARHEFALIVRSTTFGASSNITLRRCILKECYIHIERYVDGVTIEHNRLLSNGLILAGLGVGCQIDKTTGAQTIVSGLSQNIRFQNNYVQGVRDEGVDVNWHCHNVWIEGNTFHNCNSANLNEVIDVGNSTALGAVVYADRCRKVFIRDNVITCDLATVTKAGGITIKGRTSEVVIEGNTLEFTGGAVGTSSIGIRLWSVQIVTVSENVIAGYAYPIIADQGTETVPDRVTIADNFISSYGVDGLQITNGTNFKVRGNDLDGTGSTGHGFDLIQIERSEIGSNRLTNAAALGIRTQNASPDNTIVNNTVRTAVSHGFSFSAGSDRSLITGNRAISNGGTSFIFGVSDRVVFNNNIATGNGVNTPSGTGSLTNSLVGTAGNITS